MRRSEVTAAVAAIVAALDALPDSKKRAEALCCVFEGIPAESWECPAFVIRHRLDPISRNAFGRNLDGDLVRQITRKLGSTPPGLYFEAVERRARRGGMRTPGIFLVLAVDAARCWQTADAAPQRAEDPAVGAPQQNNGRLSPEVLP